MKKLLCLLLSFLLSGCAAVPEETSPVEISGSLTVVYLAGGALVQCNGEHLLVDCGSAVTPELLEKYHVESLSAIVLTGTGQEQTAGLPAVLDRFPTEVLGPAAVSDVPVTIPEPGRSRLLSCAGLTFLGPAEEEDLALLVDFGENRFLFAGTLTEASQQALTEGQGDSLACDVLHIRQSMPLTEAFTEKTHPAYAMISGRDTEELTARLNAIDADIFDTSGFGPVTAVSDGTDIRISWSLLVTKSVTA